MDIRYLAGLFDGEGCVTRIIRRYRKRRYIYARIEIASTFRPLCYRIRRHYGGNIRKVHRQQPAHYRQAYIWSMTNHDAVTLLKRLLPYLFVKRTAAKRAIKFRGGVR